MTDKYPSKYSNGKEVSPAQYITEIICERKAGNEKSDLHYRFWVQKKWAAFYRNQIGSAHKLLKQYPAKAIIRALQSDKGKKIYSLRAPHFPAMIEQQMSILETENTVITKINTERKNDVVFQKTSDTKNIISKLRDLDNES
jgi:hypothetical protein